MSGRFSASHRLITHPWSREPAAHRHGNRGQLPIGCWKKRRCCCSPSAARLFFHSSSSSRVIFLPFSSLSLFTSSPSSASVLSPLSSEQDGFFYSFFIYSSGEPAIASPLQRLLQISAFCAHTHMHACSAAIIKKICKRLMRLEAEREALSRTARMLQSDWCPLTTRQPIRSSLLPGEVLLLVWKSKHHAGGSYCGDTRCTRGNTHHPNHPSSSCSSRVPPSRCMLGNVVDSLCVETSFGKIYNLLSLFCLFNRKGLTVAWYNFQMSDDTYSIIILLKLLLLYYIYC